jgi:hypothetical protein
MLMHADEAQPYHLSTVNGYSVSAASLKTLVDFARSMNSTRVPFSGFQKLKGAISCHHDRLRRFHQLCSQHWNCHVLRRF